MSVRRDGSVVVIKIRDGWPTGDVSIGRFVPSVFVMICGDEVVC